MTPGSVTDRLWAPWRRAYVQSKKSGPCFACGAQRAGRDGKTYVVDRSHFSFSLLNLYPYNLGHIMVLPKRHVGQLHQLRDNEILDLWKLVNRTILLLKKEMKPHGFNLGMNLGRAAGAGLPKHVHVHIVPRWRGDTNFMPISAQTRVLSESLDSLYQRLSRRGRRE